MYVYFIFVLILMFSLLMESLAFEGSRNSAGLAQPAVLSTLDVTSKLKKSYRVFKMVKNDDSNNNKRFNQVKRGMKGYYRRPSKAIEQGGGFFVPGLEDERIRIVAGVILLVAVLFNSVGAPITMVNQLITQAIGVLMSLILILQGIPDDWLSGSNYQSFNRDDTSASSITVLKPPSFDSAAMNVGVENIAKNIMQSIEGLHYILIISGNDEDGKSCFEIGPLNHKNNDAAKALFSEIKENIPYKLINTMKNAPVALPDGSQDAAIFRGSQNTIWYMASISENAISRDVTWLSSMVNYPIL
jgi:hypothetical protein